MLTVTEDADPQVLEGRFFELSIEMLCILGFDRRFRRLNLAWEKTLGFTREELMGRPFIDFVHPDDRSRTLDQNSQVRGGGQARFFENRYVCKDGSYRWLLWNSTPDFERQLIYGIARDITEQKALASNLEVALAEVTALRHLLPICSYCKRIRTDQNYWQAVDEYLADHTDLRFTHGICPPCLNSTIRREFGQ